MPRSRREYLASLTLWFSWHGLIYSPGIGTGDFYARSKEEASQEKDSDKEEAR